MYSLKIAKNKALGHINSNNLLIFFYSYLENKTFSYQITHNLNKIIYTVYAKNLS